MEVQNRVIYNCEDLVRMIEDKLDQLKVFELDSKYRTMLGEPFIKKLIGWEQNIRSRMDAPYTIIVCGEIKRGKSSLINALLGEEVVTTDVTTETVTFNRISFGPHSNEAVLSGGRRIRLSDEEMAREKLEELLGQMNEPVRQLEIKRPIELLRQVTIIDTPGLGDSMRDFRETVEHVLCQADAVIYLFSVNYPLSMGEQMFLKTVILPQNYTELFLVGNYADMLAGEQEYNRVRQMLRERIHGALLTREPWILSALDERCRQTGERRPNLHMEGLLENNFLRFREQVARLVREKREMVLPDRIQRMLRGMLADLAGDLTAMEEGLAMSSRDAQSALDRVRVQESHQRERQAEAERRIDDMLRVMQSETYSWMEVLLDKMQAEVQTLSDLKTSDLTKYYSFYCIDMMQEAINRCTDYHIVILYDALDEISGEITRNLSKNARSPTYSFRFALDNKTWTMGDNVSFLISRIDRMGLLSLIADGIAGSMRQKEMSCKTLDILQSIQTQYTKLRVSVQQAIENTYHDMTEGIKREMAEYFETQILVLRRQAEQSAMAARQDEERKVETNKAICQIRAILSGMEM